MKLYFSPGACSLASHIVLREAGLQFALELVDLSTKQTADGKDFNTINPKGYVPALQLADHQVLTEGPAIIQYIADLAPEKHLIPAAGSMERYHVIENLNFIATELHRTFSPLFKTTLPEQTRQTLHEYLKKRLGFVATQLNKTGYFCSNQFSVADAYLFTVLSWSRHVGFDLAPWPTITAYLKRIGARPAVHAALVAEGLIKS